MFFACGKLGVTKTQGPQVHGATGARGLLQNEGTVVLRQRESRPGAVYEKEVVPQAGG